MRWRPALAALCCAMMLCSCEADLRDLCYDHSHATNLNVAFDWQMAPEMQPSGDIQVSQVSDESLWEMTKNYTSYLTKNHGMTLSTDPLNLTGRNTKRDSGVAGSRALGIEPVEVEKQIKEKKVKKKVPVVKFNLNIKTKKHIPKDRLVELKDSPKSNNCVYSQRENIPIRAIVKSLKRDLAHYRRDLVPVAMKKLYLLKRYKLKNKWANRAEAKKEKA